MSWTDLDRAQVAAGAEFIDFRGARLPRAFAPTSEEWHAVRHTAGVLDGRTRASLSLIGTDRVTFLQGMISNDVAKLRAGEGAYAVLLTVQGRIVSDLFVYVLGDRLLLDVPACNRLAVREALERNIVADDVEFDEGAPQPLCAVEGPQSAAILEQVAGQAFHDLPRLRGRQIRIGDTPAYCVAIDQTGECGFRVLGPATAAEPFWRALTQAGARAVGMAALDVLRLEAGIPWHGVDMDEQTLVGEVDLPGAISFTKGCYLGQEVVERLAARGHVNRKLRGLTAEVARPPRAGARLTHDGKEIGRITSAAISPALGHVVALGYVHRSAFEVGTVLRACDGDEVYDMTITDLPFHHGSASR
jgi:folate-binding protein YgfZ